MNEAVLSISYDEENSRMDVTVLLAERFTYYGFGTFLEDVTSGEVEITAEAKQVLLSLPELSGLQGMEFWPDNRLAWASPSPKFSIPTKDINVPSEAKKWIATLGNAG